MRRLLAAALLLWVLPAGALELTVFHTNDVHGRVRGMAALSSYLKTQKPPRLLLDAGDWFQGTPEGHVGRGALMIEIFNAMGYDAIEIGNHDFDFGRDNLEALVGKAKMPVLGANLYDEKTGARAAFAKPWVIKDVGGIKVGVFGLVTSATRRLTHAENYAGLAFRDEIEEARDAVKSLRAQGASVIVALTHVGFASEPGKDFDDKALAAAVPGIDLIVGGHTHTALKEPFRDPSNGTLIVQAGHSASQIGRVALRVDDKTKKLVSASAELVAPPPHAQDPAVAALIAAYEPAVRAEFDVALATAPQTLRRDRFAESALGNWMADCERASAGTDIAVQGYIPADMPAGPVTKRTILEIMPYDNHVVVVSMRGSLIREAFDRGVDRSRAIINVSGARFSYDGRRPAGGRVLSAEIGGKPLDPDKLYTVATDDFIVRSSVDSPFSRAEKKDFKTAMVRDVLAECARRQGTVSAPPGGRVTNVGEAH